MKLLLTVISIFILGLTVEARHSPKEPAPKLRSIASAGGSSAASEVAYMDRCERQGKKIDGLIDYHEGLVDRFDGSCNGTSNMVGCDDLRDLIHASTYQLEVECDGYCWDCTPKQPGSNNTY